MTNAAARKAVERAFREMGEELKLERLEDIPEGQEITLFQHGDFVDLCRGPHVQRTDQIGAVARRRLYVVTQQLHACANRAEGEQSEAFNIQRFGDVLKPLVELADTVVIVHEYIVKKHAVGALTAHGGHRVDGGPAPARRLRTS